MFPQECKLSFSVLEYLCNDHVQFWTHENIQFKSSTNGNTEYFHFGPAWIQQIVLMAGPCGEGITFNLVLSFTTYKGHRLPAGAPVTSTVHQQSLVPAPPPLRSPVIFFLLNTRLPPNWPSQIDGRYHQSLLQCTEEFAVVHPGRKKTLCVSQATSPN